MQKNLGADKLTALLNGDNLIKHNEPLLEKNISDYIPKEDDKMNKDFKEFYGKLISLFWSPGHIKLDIDQIHMKNKLNVKEINVLKFVILFFANADKIVADNINFNLGAAVQPFFAKACYNYIASSEDIHAITYDELTLALFPEGTDELKKNIINIPAIRAKIAFMAKWMNGDCTFHECVIAFLCVEAIMFSASFSIIFWFKTRGLLPGTTQANEYIFKDEGLHQDYGILIHKYIKNKTSVNKMKEIIMEAVEIECNFVDAALPETINDLSAGRIKGYVKFVADRLCKQLDIDVIYNIVNPCSYMVELGIGNKTNFFEKTSTDYLTPSPNKSLKLIERF
jgi:ribonucleotide reductase beta subunit family protein with ferritin-like domain